MNIPTPTADEQQTIRPYGPGKFSTWLDAYVYDVSLDGGAEEETHLGGSWFGLMRHGSTIFKDHDPLCEALTVTERETLTACAGVILREDSDGFVAVTYYDTKEDMDRDWSAIEAESAEAEEDQ